jgi:hypothetical protein
LPGATCPSRCFSPPNESGKFVASNLKSGKYSIRVTKEGFDDLVTAVDLHGTADLPLQLTITEQRTSITVNEKSTAFANSDAVYRQLRDDGFGNTYRCEHFTLPMDVGTFEFKSGTITQQVRDGGYLRRSGARYTEAARYHGHSRDGSARRPSDRRGRLHRSGFSV